MPPITLTTVAVPSSAPLQVTSVLAVGPDESTEAPATKKLIGDGFVKQLLESVTIKLYDPAHKLAKVSTVTLPGNVTEGLASKVYVYG